MVPSNEADASSATPSQAWVRDISLFLGGQTASLLGSSLVQYAVLWYLTLTTKDGTILALSIVFGFLPQAIVSIFGGVWADRHNRKFLIMGADAAIALATLALALLMLNGVDSLWLIFAVLAVRSTGAGIQTPAVSAVIPQIVPQDKLMRINGINGTIQSAMMIVAPALAAILYANLDLEYIFFIDVVTAVIGIGLLALVPLKAVSRGDELAGYFDDLKEGVRYVRTHPYVMWLLSLFGAVMVLGAAPSMLTPLMVARTFGEEVWKLTALELAFSIGMMISGALVAAIGDRFQRTSLIVWSTLVLAGLTAALGLSPFLWVFLTVMFLVGFAIPFFTVPSFTVLQESVEPDRLGRVFGFVSIVGAVSMPIGMAVFGPLADVFSVQTVLIVAGLLTFVAAALAFLTPGGRAALTYVREHRPAAPEGAEPSAESPAPQPNSQQEAPPSPLLP
ncbi:MFS transporter [Demequina sp.]|uniref:MFS transporter n=1 Tax=Demequina sp. TaxID=2050685 RepID=UPI003D1063BC